MTLWFGAQCKSRMKTFSLTTAKEGKATGQEFSHLQRSHKTKRSPYRLIRTNRNSTFLPEHTVTLAAADGNEIYATQGASELFGCNSGSYMHSELAQTSVA